MKDMLSQHLDGEWLLKMDGENVGREAHWYGAVQPAARPAPVPGAIQEVFPGQHGVCWYWHRFTLSAKPAEGEKMKLCFGAVDYLADVWLNGVYTGGFEGGETPFALDVTPILRTEGENLLAVRVLNPTYAFIDGITLSQTPHQNKDMTPTAGCGLNFGGIFYPVELRCVPPCRMEDVFARPDWMTGKIRLSVRLRAEEACRASISLTVSEEGTMDGVVGTREGTYDVPQGESTQDLEVNVEPFRLWSVDAPNLYDLRVELRAPGQRAHVMRVTCGFRDFRVQDGWFTLNGKRILLKCAHSGNPFPIGIKVPREADQLRRDIINAKASGFNAIRAMGLYRPEQLDFCDRMGMLILEESFACWLMGAPGCGYDYDQRYPRVPYDPVILKRYDHNTTQMILRDRNHPCLVMWYLLNETGDGVIFRNAVDFLPKLRAIDPDRTVLLSSGRFDGHFDIGSVSNPGSDVWETVWGTESPDLREQQPGRYPSAVGAGDVHYYPQVPFDQEARTTLREMGKGTKPIFVSEIGIGSLFDVINEWRHFQQFGADPDLMDMAWVRRQSEKLYADWKRYGLENVYPFVEDMLRESQRLNARQRTLLLDLMRSNPNICAISQTGLLDHGYCGEGLWRFWREWKPGMFDAMCDGYSPLRWCLFVTPEHAYAGQEVSVEAVLATEDVLRSGVYPASFRVFGPSGCVWSARREIRIGEDKPLAVSVLKERFCIDGPSGEYVLAANMDEGGAPTGSTLKFHVTNSGALPALTGCAQAWGLPEATERWLEGKGLALRSFASGDAGKLILVGNPEDFSSRAAVLRERIEAGARVLFLDAALFLDRPEHLARLPLTQPGLCKNVADGLYHMECVAARSPVFDGLQGPGVMDMEYYGQVTPHEVFADIQTPDETLCAAFNTGYIFAPDSYCSSVIMGMYRAGRGAFVLSTPYMLKWLGRHPAADGLLVNLVNYARAL